MYGAHSLCAYLFFLWLWYVNYLMYPGTSNFHDRIFLSSLVSTRMYPYLYKSLAQRYSNAIFFPLSSFADQWPLSSSQFLSVSTAYLLYVHKNLAPRYSLSMNSFRIIISAGWLRDVNEDQIEAACHKILKLSTMV